MRAGARAGVVCALALTVVVVGLARAEEPFKSGLFPPLPVVRPSALARPPRIDPRAVPGTLKTTQARADELRASPLHGDVFFVADVVGEDRSRTVYVVPQYHRSPTSPLMFTSIGAAVRDVQTRIEALVLHLARRHALACVGTEGDQTAAMPRSFELERLAYQLHDLRVAAREAQVVFPDDVSAREAIEALIVVVERAAREHAELLDGVGMAMDRLAGERALVRFGLEDEALLARALDVAGKMDALYREREALVPDEMSTSADTVRDLVLEEFPLYREATLDPLDDAIATLEARRAALVREGAPELATLVTRLLARARRLVDETVRPDAVRALHAHYASLASPSDAGVARATPTRKMSARERRRLARIDDELGALEREHARVTRAERERVAAHRVRARLADAPVCALVMGAHHERALVEALTRGDDAPGVIVVRPFPPEDAPRGD